MRFWLIPAIYKRISKLFRSTVPVPDEFRKLFFHLYMDMAGMGILAGSTMSFLAVYATRQGADPAQIGLLSAVPGLVNLLFALPVAGWLGYRSLGKAVFWASVASRIFYVFLIPLPVLLIPQTQIWLIILVSLIMTIPGTAVVIGFNAMFADVVPLEWRGHVLGIRNAFLYFLATGMTLVAGQILGRVGFPLGYQIVFGIGFLGAGFSSYHLYKLANLEGLLKGKSPARSDIQPQVPSASNRIRSKFITMFQRWNVSMRFDVMKGPYARIMGLFFSWHLFQFMAIPCVTLFIVNQLKINDQMIGLANSLFNITVFLGSLKLGQAAARFGNKKLTGGGILFLALFPILTSFGVPLYLLANIVCGFAFAMVTGGSYNYIMEKVPGNDRPAYMAWYSLVANGAMLVGSLVGPAVGAEIGLATALIIFGICRFLAGAAILRWG